LGYGYALAVCAVLFVLSLSAIGVLAWSLVNRNELRRALLTHPRDRKRARHAQNEGAKGPDPDDPHDLRTDAQADPRAER